MLNYGKSKVRMLIITSQLRSINNGRSPMILPPPVEDRGHLSGIVSLYQAWTIDEWLTKFGPHAKASCLPECQWLVDRLVAADNRRLARAYSGVNVVHRAWRFRLSNEENERHTSRATSQGPSLYCSSEEAPTRHR
jgi:hypothetical protein